MGFCDVSYSRNGLHRKTPCRNSGKGKSLMFLNSFWVGVCAFASVTLAMLVLIDFGIYIAGRYRERYLEEAKTELDDILIQLPASRMLDLSIALSVAGAIITVVITSTQSDQIGPEIGRAHV